MYKHIYANNLKKNKKLDWQMIFLLLLWQYSDLLWQYKAASGVWLCWMEIVEPEEMRFWKNKI